MEEYKATKAHVGAVVAGLMSALTAVLATYLKGDEAMEISAALGTVITFGVTWGIVYWTKNKPKENTENA